LPPEGPERLIREYRDYDARCDVVSCFEVYFTEARQMVETVEHFDRFPRFDGADGQPVKPDFTVRFRDGTMLVGEISRLARNDESLESLLHQIGRYDALTKGPSAAAAGGGHELAPTEAVDVLLLVPSGEANAARDRIDEAIREKRYDYVPTVRPCVLGYSYDDATSRYVFTYDDRSGNPRPRSHGRKPSLETWLLANSDTLTCPSERFSRITAIKRFMNDRPPAFYTATLLWLDALPALAHPEVPPVDVAVTPAQTAEWLRTHYGWGDVIAVRAALDFLQRAGLARQRKDDWLVALKAIANSKEEVRRELADRYLAKPRGPVTASDRQERDERRDRDREEADQNQRRQEPLNLEPEGF
jgi:hypothetical protein